MKKVIVTGFSDEASERLKEHFRHYVGGAFPARAFIEHSDSSRIFFEDFKHTWWEIEAFVYHEETETT